VISRACSSAHTGVPMARRSRHPSNSGQWPVSSRRRKRPGAGTQTRWARCRGWSQPIPDTIASAQFVLMLSGAPTVSSNVATAASVNSAFLTGLVMCGFASFHFGGPWISGRRHMLTTSSISGFGADERGWIFISAAMSTAAPAAIIRSPMLTTL
jgi:hypothetical protein